MTPVAFWSSVFFAVLAFAVCLLVFETTMTLAAGLSGAMVILTALTYRPRPSPYDRYC